MYSINFNDFTIRNDLLNSDQALKTIDFCNKNENMTLVLKNINSESSKKFLNKNISIKEENKKNVLAELKKIKSKNSSAKVDLEISKEASNKFDKIDIASAIKMIEDKKDDDLFNIKFYDANEIAQLITDKNEIDIELFEISYELLNVFLEKIISNEYSLEIHTSKEELKNKIEKINIDYYEFYEDSTKTSKTFKKNELKKKIENMTNHELYSIKLNKINKQTLQETLDLFTYCKFNIKFLKMEEFSYLFESEDNFAAQIAIKRLNKGKAKSIINHLRKENADFSLVFEDVTYQQMLEDLANCLIEQENIIVNSKKRISELFLKEHRPTSEIEEFNERGIEYLIEVSEKKFIPWLNITAVCVIGAIQVVAGVALVYSGFGATVGIGNTRFFEIEINFRLF